MGLPVPSKYQLIWAANALNAYVRSIPTQSQIGIQNGAASLNDGFPPLNFTPETAGGTPPFGQDFNGIFRLITQIQQYQQAGGAWTYDSDFATAINGYPINAIVASAAEPGYVSLYGVGDAAGNESPWHADPFISGSGIARLRHC